MTRWVRRWGIEVFVACVAAGVRFATYSSGIGLRAAIGYDDSAYFAGAQAFAAGHLPYRDFPFLQPPGVVLVPTPFALLGHFVGGDLAMAGLRLAMIALSAVTCALIANLLRRYGTVASLSGSLLYATHVLPVIFGRTYYLEPFLAFAVVLTFWLLRRVPLRRRSYALVGLVMGVACTVKIWAAVDVAVLAVFVASTRGRRMVGAWLTGVAGVAVAVYLPFFVADPHAMWQQVVAAQLGRIRLESVADRLAMFNGFGGFPGWSMQLGHTSTLVVVSAALSFASIPLVVELWQRHRPHDWDEAAWWVVLGGAELGTLLMAPTFFQHYLVWPLAPLSLGIGRTLGWLARGRARIPLLAGALVTASCLAVVPFRARVIALHVDVPPVRSFAAAHDCTWFDSTVVQVFVTSRKVPALAPCRPWPDPHGVAILYGGRAHRDPLLAEADIPAWQTGVQAQLRAADSAILCDPAFEARLDATTRQVFKDRFVRRGRGALAPGACSYWVRRVSD